MQAGSIPAAIRDNLLDCYNGAIADDDGKVYIYYAASDTCLHVASTTIGQLLDFAFKTPADLLRRRECMAQRVALSEKNQAYLNQQDR